MRLLYNRNYALRRIRDAFRENKSLAGQDEVKKQYQFANENLNTIRRQVRIEIVIQLIQLTLWKSDKCSINLMNLLSFFHFNR